MGEELAMQVRAAHRTEERGDALEVVPRTANRKAYNAKYHATHREEIKRRKAKHRAAHPEKDRARNAAWRAAHPDYDAAWYADNREHRKAYNASYRKTSKGKESRKFSRSRRSAIERQIKIIAPDLALTHWQWKKILRLCDGRCHWCKRKMKEITQDHVIPLSKGGLHVAENIVAACRRCNRKKGTKRYTLF